MKQEMSDEKRERAEMTAVGGGTLERVNERDASCRSNTQDINALRMSQGKIEVGFVIVVSFQGDAANVNQLFYVNISILIYICICV